MKIAGRAACTGTETEFEFLPWNSTAIVTLLLPLLKYGTTQLIGPAETQTIVTATPSKRIRVCATCVETRPPVYCNPAKAAGPMPEPKIVTISPGCLVADGCK